MSKRKQIEIIRREVERQIKTVMEVIIEVRGEAARAKLQEIKEYQERLCAEEMRGYRKGQIVIHQLDGRRMVILEVKGSEGSDRVMATCRYWNGNIEDYSVSSFYLRELIPEKDTQDSPAKQPSTIGGLRPKK